ncbi:MAG: UvrD-helicase domain-containing protein [Thermoplasmata archaeon]|nr:UvrD-helicase domain-containing protein [Thermoplasmata archaeon]
MSELNESQKRIAETLDGMLIVDAGPGTGKTHTIVRRYINLVSRKDESGQPMAGPRDVLLLTFTRNAAAEMEERIKRTMSEEGMTAESKLVQVQTFDAFCLSVVMESPDDAGRLFGIDEHLTHSVRLVENQSLNRTYFSTFLDMFLDSRGEDYGDAAVVFSQMHLDVYDLINRLMSRGIYPLKKGWFGGSDGDELYGDISGLAAGLLDLNTAGKRGGKSPACKAVSDMDQGSYDPLPEIGEAAELDRSVIEEAAREDRRDLINLIHDVYWHYIRSCIADDRLTFGVNAMLAFSILYTNATVRMLNSYRYLMIDEFQDTNSGQLMMALMMLKEPNLCAVGDWKQGIYGFRYVSIDNITDFERRAVALRRQLNEDGNRRVAFGIPETVRLPLDENYRSSQRIIDMAFDGLYIPATGDEKLDTAKLDADVTRIRAAREDIGEDTAIRFVQCEAKDAEAAMVARCVRDYVGSGNYTVRRDRESRPMGYGDIAVLCRTVEACRTVVDRLTAEGIPAFLQGDVELMSTREGKLALAWLRYVNNSRDPWGYVPIMADLGYPLVAIQRAFRKEEGIPGEIVRQREILYRKRRRVTDLLTTMFGWYGLDNDITQALITVLSTAHRDSLMTISDLIGIIEDDISNGSKATYSVDADLDADAVIVTTMHKAKGLEFPAVIIPYVDDKTFPSTKGDSSLLYFDPLTGVRCRRTVGRFGDYAKVCRSWRADLARMCLRHDYDEERRLLFVALSRAKQYETLICAKPSKFMTALSGGCYTAIEDHPAPPASESAGMLKRPDLTGYETRRPNLGVHSILVFTGEDNPDPSGEVDEIGGKGMEYGTKVHREAELLDRGLKPSGEFPEAEYILEEVLSRKKDPLFIRSYPEVECTLPIEKAGVVMKGVIDLLLLFEDRVEVHDYKTDVSDRFQGEYEIQLSIYALAASLYYPTLPVRCFIDYVSQGRTVEFEPMEREDLELLVAQRVEGQGLLR